MVEQNTKWLVGKSLHRQFFLEGGIDFGVASRSLGRCKSISVPLTVHDNVELFTHCFEAMASNVRDQVFLDWLDCVQTEHWVSASREPISKNG